MLRCACSANAKVSCRRRGDTISAPIPETFSCERARTGSVGVAPRGAHVRRSTGSIRNPVSSRQTRWAPRRCSFFYRGPIDLDPLAHAPVVALFRARLGALRTEATGPEQPPDVVGMVEDLEAIADQLNESPTRPQAGAIAGGFRSGDDEAGQVPALDGAELGRSTGRWSRAETGGALSSVSSLPTPDGAPIDTEAVRHHMNGDLPLQQFNRTQPSPLELSRAPRWAHRVPPTVEHNVLGHYLHRNH